MTGETIPTFTTHQYKYFSAPSDDILDLEEDVVWEVKERIKLAADYQEAMIVFGPSWRRLIDNAYNDILQDIEDRVLFRKLK